MTDMVRTTEIAEMLGITRPRASQLTRTAGFPAPVKTQRRSKWWNRERDRSLGAAPRPVVRRPSAHT